MRRIKCDTRVWHVFCRGARRLNLFHEETDFLVFLTLLTDALRATGCELWAYVLMSNHFHLAVRADSGQLSRLMRRVDYGYSKYHNKRYGLSGHAFDGPYKAFPQGAWINILYMIAYIFLNPVTAKMVPHPDAYRWSGYASFMGLQGSPLAVQSAPALDRLSKNSSEARKEFLRILERQQALLKRRPPAVLSREEVLSRQFESLSDYAHDVGAFAGLTPAEVAIYWGCKAGIPTRVMARVLAKDPARITYLKRVLLRRVAQDSALEKSLDLPG